MTGNVFPKHHVLSVPCTSAFMLSFTTAGSLRICHTVIKGQPWWKTGSFVSGAHSAVGSLLQSPGMKATDLDLDHGMM